MEKFRVFRVFRALIRAGKHTTATLCSLRSLHHPVRSHGIHVTYTVHCTYSCTHTERNALSACANSINWQQPLVKKKLVSFQNEDIIDHFCGTNNYCFTLCPLRCSLSAPFHRYFYPILSICTLAVSFHDFFVRCRRRRRRRCCSSSNVTITIRIIFNSRSLSSLFLGYLWQRICAIVCMMLNENEIGT